MPKTNSSGEKKKTSPQARAAVSKPGQEQGGANAGRGAKPSSKSSRKA